MKEGTIVLPCTCEHAAQDEIYGKGKRLHNVNTSNEASCTVCDVSYRRNKQSTQVEPNKLFGHGYIPARPGKKLKKVYDKDSRTEPGETKKKS